MTVSHKSVNESLQFSHTVHGVKRNSSTFQMNIFAHFQVLQQRQFGKNKIILLQNSYINHKWVKNQIVEFTNTTHKAYSWSLFKASLHSPSLHWSERYRKVPSKVTARSQGGDIHNFVKQKRRMWILDCLNDNFTDKVM